MKITWYRSATVGITSRSGTKILCDPWITDGAFIGSWFHWPPLEGFEFEEILKVDWDAIYISHLHADHFDRKLVAALAKHHPNLKVILPNFAHPWLLRAVKNCGFLDSQLITIKSGNWTKIKDIEVRVLTADHCNPSICGVNIPCHQANSKLSAIDSIALFRADGQTILNANDSLAVSSIPRALKEIGEIDLLLGHFGGAGPYPQCFDDLLNLEKISESKKLANQFVQRLAFACEITKSRYVFPYAGQYLLAGRLSPLNEFRSVLSLEETINVLSNSTSSIAISLAPFGEFDLCTEKENFKYIEPTKLIRQNYLEKISFVKFPYERKEENWPDSTNEMLDAAQNVIRTFNSNPYLNLQLADSSYILKISLESSVTINFKGSQASAVIGENPSSENVTKISTDHRLWRRVISRRPNYKGFTTFHFNQAEIGSHLSWHRIGEYRPEVRFLDFLHHK